MYFGQEIQCMDIIFGKNPKKIKFVLKILDFLLYIIKRKINKKISIFLKSLDN